MNITVLYFAAVREKLGKKSEDIRIEEGDSLNKVMEILSSRYEFIAEMDKSLMVAVNRTYCDRDFILRDGDEIALIPPVSGG